MEHGLYYRLGPCNVDCIEELRYICDRKGIECDTARFCYIRQKVITHYMKVIVSFIEKYYLPKLKEEDHKPFVRYDFQCGICLEIRTTFNLCRVCKFYICIDCMKQLQTPHCAQCRTEDILKDVSYRDTERVFKEMFAHDFNFILCIDLDDMLLDVVSRSDYIVIKEEYDCFCYEDFPEPKAPDYFLILKNRRTGRITNRDVVDQVLEQGYKCDIDTCAHRYYEGCRSTRQRRSKEYEICWSS